MIERHVLTADAEHLSVPVGEESIVFDERGLERVRGGSERQFDDDVGEGKVAASLQREKEIREERERR